MAFGQIDYRQPVPNAAPAIEQAGRQVQAGLEEAAAGALKFKQSVLQNQALQASTLLGKTLQETNDFIAQTPYMKHSDAQQAFQGAAWESLPESLKTSIQTGPTSDVDPGIPMWRLAPHIFNKVAVETADKAAGLIEEQGWADEFRVQAAGETTGYRSRMLAHQFESFKADSVLSEKAAYDQAVGAGEWVLARSYVSAMKFHSPAQRDILMKGVDKEEALRPSRQALISADPAKADEVIKQMQEDPKALANLNEAERTETTLKMQAHKHYLATEEAKRLKLWHQGRADLHENVLMDYGRRGIAPPLSVLPEITSKSGVLAEDRTRLYRVWEMLQDPKSKTAQKESDPQSEAYLYNLAAYHPEVFQAMDLTTVKGLSPHRLIAWSEKQLTGRNDTGDATHVEERKVLHDAAMTMLQDLYGKNFDPVKNTNDAIIFSKLMPGFEKAAEEEKLNLAKGGTGKRAPLSPTQALALAGRTFGNKSTWHEPNTGTELLAKTSPLVAAAVTDTITERSGRQDPQTRAAVLAEYKAMVPSIEEAWKKLHTDLPITESDRTQLFRRFNSPRERKQAEDILRASGKKISDPGIMETLIQQGLSEAEKAEAKSAFLEEERKRALKAAVAAAEMEAKSGGPGAKRVAEDTSAADALKKQLTKGQ